MTPQRTTPTLPEAKPTYSAWLKDVPPRRSHPVFVYLGRLSPSSRRVMERALERIAELLGLKVEEIRWWGIGDRYLRAIREALGRNYSAATANQSLSALRGVAGVALEMRDRGMDVGISDERYDAYLAVPLFPRKPAPRTRAPSRREIARLIRSAAAEADAKALRDAAMLTLLVRAGLKRSELAALRLADYEPRSGTLRAGERSVRLERDERALLRGWIVYRGRAHGPLFVPMRKGGVTESRTMSGTAIAQIVAERAEQAGLGALSPEDLRRDAASRR